MLKNAASGVPCLRRASFADVATKAESGFTSTRKRAGRSPLGRAHVLLRTLCSPKRLRPFLREASGQDWTSLFEHSTNLLWWVSGIHLLMKWQKILKYSTAHLANTPAQLPMAYGFSQVCSAQWEASRILLWRAYGGWIPHHTSFSLAADQGMTNFVDIIYSTSRLILRNSGPNMEGRRANSIITWLVVTEEAMD